MNLDKPEDGSVLDAWTAGKTGLAARLMEISRETAPLMKDGGTLKEVMDELYDEETGLPK